MVDIYGDHLVSCCKLGLASRHNAIRDVIHAFCERHNIQCQKEVAVPIPAPPPAGSVPRLRPVARRPADILLIGWDHGRDVAVDFVVSHPLAMSYQGRSIDRAKRHLKDVEARKVADEGALCTLNSWGFAPAAFSPWGATGTNAGALLFELSRRATANLSGWRKTKKVQEFYENLSLTLARRVAMALKAKNRVQAEREPLDGGEEAARRLVMR